jgi:hypothetical protein
MDRIKNNRMGQVISFARVKNSNKVITIVNYSAKPVTVVLESEIDKGEYVNWFSGEREQLKGMDTLSLNQWEYKVLVQK